MSGIKKEKKKGLNLLKVFKKAKGFDRTTTAIPPIVHEPILWLKERNALGEEGIFRIPGSATQIKELKLRYDKGKKVDLSAIENVHTVAGLLKVFFRELPEPLLTFELYDAWLAALKPDDMRTKLEYLRRVLDTLPAGNRIILDTIISFLKEVSLHTSNCMNIKNLAIVFSPNLIRPKVEKIEDILANSTSVNTLMVLLIQYYNFLFLGKSFDENVAPEEIPVTPQLISLERARALHKTDVSDTSKSLKTKKTGKKTKDPRKPKKLTIGETPRTRKKSVSKKNADEEFLSTLKYGTIKLANSLLEEQEILCELQDIDALSPEEISKIEKRLIHKVKESKVQKSKARTARKDQRLRFSNFNRLRELNENQMVEEPKPQNKLETTDKNDGTLDFIENKEVIKDVENKGIIEDIGSEDVIKDVENKDTLEAIENEEVIKDVESKDVIKDVENKYTLEVIENEEVIKDIDNSGIIEDVESEDIIKDVKNENTSEGATIENEDELALIDNKESIEFVENEIVVDDVENEVNDIFSEELNEDYFKFEDELDDILYSDEEEEEFDKMLEESDPHITEENDITNIAQHISRKAQINSVVESVLEGDMGVFQNYLGEFKTMARVDRSKSKRQMLAKINLVNQTNESQDNLHHFLE